MNQDNTCVFSANYQRKGQRAKGIIERDSLVEAFVTIDSVKQSRKIGG